MIALDSNIFIYALEANPDFGRESLAVLLLPETSGMGLCSSALTFTEVLSYSKLSAEQIQQAQHKLRYFDVQYRQISEIILLQAATLRRELRLGLADAIQVATALDAKATHFVTNDQRLLAKAVPDVQFVPVKQAASMLNIKV